MTSKKYLGKTAGWDVYLDANYKHENSNDKNWHYISENVSLRYAHYNTQSKTIILSPYFIKNIKNGPVFLFKSGEYECVLTPGDKLPFELNKKKLTSNEIQEVEEESKKWGLSFDVIQALRWKFKQIDCDLLKDIAIRVSVDELRSITEYTLSKSEGMFSEYDSVFCLFNGVKNVSDISPYVEYIEDYSEKFNFKVNEKENVNSIVEEGPNTNPGSIHYKIAVHFNSKWY